MYWVLSVTMKIILCLIIRSIISKEQSVYEKLEKKCCTLSGKCCIVFLLFYLQRIIQVEQWIPAIMRSHASVAWHKQTWLSWKCLSPQWGNNDLHCSYEFSCIQYFILVGILIVMNFAIWFSLSAVRIKLVLPSWYDQIFIPLLIWQNCLISHSERSTEVGENMHFGF